MQPKPNLCLLVRKLNGDNIDVISPECWPFSSLPITLLRAAFAQGGSGQTQICSRSGPACSRLLRLCSGFRCKGENEKSFKFKRGHENCPPWWIKTTLQRVHLLRTNASIPIGLALLNSSEIGGRVSDALRRAEVTCVGNSFLFWNSMSTIVLIVLVFMACLARFTCKFTAIE